MAEPPSDLLSPPDDLTDADGPPPDLLSPPDDLTDSAPAPSRTDTLIHAAERGVAPALTGMAGMGLGAELGAAVAPLAGPAAPIVPIIGALAGGFGAAYLTSEAQEKLLSMLPEGVRAYIGQSAAQRAAEGDAHPVISVAGEMLPQLLTMRPGSTLPLREGANAIERLFSHPVTSRVIGGGLGAGQEAAQEAASDQPVSPARIATAAGVGAALNRPTALGERLEQAGARLVPGARPRPDVTPAPDVEPEQPPPPPPEGAPSPGDVVGLRQKGGPPERVVVESVQDGYVFYRDQDNRQRADAIDEFTRDLTDAPAARNPEQGDATTVPEPPPDSTPPPDLLDEMYAEQAEREPLTPPRPKPPSPQTDLPLPETRIVDDLLGQAAAQREAAARVRETKPEDVAFFERSAASLEARAKDLSDRMAAPADTVRDVDLRPVDEDALKLGALGEHAREPGEPAPEPVAPPPAGQDTGLGPLGRFARPENGEPPVPERPAAPEAEPPAPIDRRYEISQRRSEAARKARMTRIGNRPLDLAEFIAKNGGIRLDDPAIADVRQVIGAPQKMVRDFGPLIRRTGKPLDEMRELAEEAGYFGNREGTTVPDLIDAIDRQVRGQRQFSSRDAGEVTERAAEAGAARAADEFENTYGPDGEGETRFAAKRMKDAGLLDESLDPLADHPDDLRAAIDERLAMMDAPDVDAALGALDTARDPAIAREAQKGTQDGDFDLGALATAERTPSAERPPESGAQPEPHAGPEEGGGGGSGPPGEDQPPSGRTGEEGAPVSERQLERDPNFFDAIVRAGDPRSEYPFFTDDMRVIDGAGYQGDLGVRLGVRFSNPARFNSKTEASESLLGRDVYAGLEKPQAGRMSDVERAHLDADKLVGDAAREAGYDAIIYGNGEIQVIDKAKLPQARRIEFDDDGGTYVYSDDRQPWSVGDGARAYIERASAPKTETVDTLDGPREQYVVPGAERTEAVNPEDARQADIARLESEQSKLRSRKTQESVRDQEGGLFSSDRDQGTLYSGVDPFRVAGEVGRIYRRIADSLTTRAGKAADTEATARAAVHVTAAAPPPSLTLRNLSWFGRTFSFPAGLAARDAISARYFGRLLERQRAKETLDRDGAATLQPYYRLSPESKERVNRVLEYRRIAGEDIRDTGRRVILRVPNGVKLELSKPGDVIALTRDETDAFHTVRRYADQRLLQFGEAMARQMGYDGEFSPDGISRAQDEATDQGQRKAAVRAGEIYQAVVEDGRRRGYIPFSRYGNYFIKILPKVAETPGRDATPPRLEDGRFELVETGSPLDFLKSTAVRGTPKQAAERLAELEKQYQRDKYDYTHGFVTPKAVESLDIPLLDRMVMAVGLQDPELGARLYDDVYRQVLDERMAGFRKESRNIPGYSTDFERSLSIYNRQSGDVIANMRHGRDIEAAFDETQRHPSRDIRRFWKAHREHLDGPSQDFARIRQFGFLNFLWGSPSSALVNLSQTPLVTANQIAGWAGARGFGLANGAMIEGLRAIRVTPRGVTVDWNAVGKTPAERQMIAELRKDGTLDPAIALDLQGGDITDSQRLRPYARKMKAVYDAGASMFNAAEQVNRAAAALAYFRAAQAPGGIEAARKFYASDALFQEQVGHAISPTAIARYGVDETQFIGGKLNRQPIQRGLGSVLFQFHTYPANYVRLLYKNFGRMGGEGKTAGTLMLMALAGSSGLFGLPFVDDITSAGEAVWKAVTDEDPMIERRFRQALIDVGFDQYGAEALVRGPTRSLLGVDLSRRLGMGQIAPNVSGIDAFGPFASATVGRALEIAQRLKSGQPMGAAAAAVQTVAGKGPSDLVRAAALKTEGYRTRLGAGKFAPSDVTGAEVAERALGFNPARFARRSEQEMSDRRAAAADQQSASQFTTNVATALAFAEKERRAGNESAAAEYRAEAQRLMTARAKAGKTVNQAAIRSRVQAILAPKEAMAKRAPKRTRADVLASPFPSE